MPSRRRGGDGQTLGLTAPAFMRLADGVARQRDDDATLGAFTYPVSSNFSLPAV